MTLIEFATRAASVPFVDHGRDFDGWDCWGLVRCGLAAVWGIDVPSYSAGYEDAGRTRAGVQACAQVIADATSGPDPVWREVDRPVAGDVVVLRLKGRPIHVGLMIDDRRFMHTEAGTGTNHGDTNRTEWRNRVIGFFRHART